MRVCAHHCVGECPFDSVYFADHDHARKVFDVYLVDDSSPWRHDFEFIECTLSPPKEPVTLLVPHVFDVGIGFKGVFAPEDIGNHRVVDYQLSWSQRVDPGWVAA
ncbi:hypothetical protein GALL_555150 [mine drainage metagenome]|uniref:Uncharacterized protein n=1 Tax=mine drainage metagenome TaxID=410659 RepID=A0A1J5PHB3_9ZZZZ